MALEEMGDLERIFGMLLLPQREGLKALQKLEGIEGTKAGTDVAKKLNSDLDNKRDVSQPGEVPKDIPDL